MIVLCRNAGFCPPALSCNSRSPYNRRDPGIQIVSRLFNPQHGASVTRLPLRPTVSQAWGGQEKYPHTGPTNPPVYQSPYYSSEPPYQQPPQYGMSEEEQVDRLAVGTALRNIGWLSFWGQLVLTVVSAVILLFSVGVTNQGAVNFNLINASTLVGVVASLISTFLAWSYVQAGRKLGMLQDVKLSKVEGTVIRGTTLNLIGMGATLIGLQATVGGLVAKTLSSAAAGPFYRGAAPPPVALDVFSVQACTNTVMAHFLGIAFSTWLLRVLNNYIQKNSAAASSPAPSAPPLPLV